MNCRTLSAVLASVLAFGLAACSEGSGQPAADTASPASPVPSAEPVATASAAASAKERKVSESSELIEFEYTYPAQAAAVPALRQWLEADLAARRSELTTAARDGKREAQGADFEFRPYGYWAGWDVVADLPGWLSLSAHVSTFTGGAHPNHNFGATLWDKSAGQRHEPLDLFVSKQALSSAIRKDFCAALDKERNSRRGGEALDGMFSECIDPVDSTIILGSSNRATFDRIGVLIAPYEAGPYAEGPYEVTLPVNAGILGTVKPEFRGAFAIKR